MHHGACEIPYDQVAGTEISTPPKDSQRQPTADPAPRSDCGRDSGTFLPSAAEPAADPEEVELLCVLKLPSADQVPPSATAATATAAVPITACRRRRIRRRAVAARSPASAWGASSAISRKASSILVSRSSSRIGLLLPAHSVLQARQRAVHV